MAKTVIEKSKRTEILENAAKVTIGLSVASLGFDAFEALKPVVTEVIEIDSIVEEMEV